jgi:RNA recognition motif-containing protein
MRPDKIRGNVFVANLPHGFTDAQLAEAFDPYGIVLIAHLARDPATGKTCGHGLVQLAPDRAVEDAVASLNETGIAGRRIEARRADPEMGISPPTQPRRRVDSPRSFQGGASTPALRRSMPSTSEQGTIQRRHTLSLAGH